MKRSLILLALVVASILVIRPASAEPPTTETAGSSVLPPPVPKFRGTIGRTFKDSTQDVFDVIKAPSGAPNVLFVLIDDCGFGQWGTFGGQVPTPNLDKLARKGLRYNRFHTTALCSPSRAALLTGRNHHSAATGNITELGDSFPGYTGQVPKSCAMVSEIVRQNGYSTAFFGKNHNIADWETSISGPFDRWPGLQGFDHFYGFVGGEANQWQPALYENTAPTEMEIPKGREADYTLNEHLANKAIDYIHQQKSVTPDRPFFVYYAPGATHAPHHVPKDWLAKFKGQFDRGWDAYREETFARQKTLGVIPPETRLTPRPKEIPSWDSLTDEQRKVAARLMEAFAAYTAQTDQEVGRVIDEIGAMGIADNTLIFWEIGDNGASMEGSLLGLFNEMVGLGGEKEDPAYIQAHLDEVGGPKAYNHYPVGWAWAMNTPFQWGKQVASHLGGVRNPLVVSWPKRIKDQGGLRSQFHHLIDIAPTILDVIGIREPASVNGVTQKPIEGISMAYSFDKPEAKSPRKTQYFEMFGNRAIYDDGWMATCRHGRLPWENKGSSDFDADEWQLYNLDEDFSESNDLAAKHPRKLRGLQDLFWVEAAKHDVLPLDDRFIERADPSMRPSLIAGKTKFRYFAGARRIPESSSPNIKNRTHTIAAEVEIPAGGADGVLVASGGIVGGYTLFIKDGKPVYEYNRFTSARCRIASPDALAPGKHAIRAVFLYDGGGIGKGRTVSLLVDGKKVAEGRVEQTVAARFSADETFDTGLDTGSPVSDAYESPFGFAGKLEKIEIDIKPELVGKADLETLRRLGAARRVAE